MQSNLCPSESQNGPAVPCWTLTSMVSLRVSCSWSPGVTSQITLTLPSYSQASLWSSLSRHLKSNSAQSVPFTPEFRPYHHKNRLTEIQYLIFDFSFLCFPDACHLHNTPVHATTSLTSSSSQSLEILLVLQKKINVAYFKFKNKHYIRISLDLQKNKF